MQEPQPDVNIQVTPSGRLQISQQAPMRALTDRELDAIRDRREDIRTQLNSAVDRRNDLAGDLKDAPPGTEAGVLARIQLLDQRILQIERDMEESGRMLRTGLTVDNGTTLVAPQTGFNSLSQDTQTIIGLSFSFFVLFPIALIVTRAAWRRTRRSQAPQNSPEQEGRMDRLEQAVDAVAIEIERVGEAQRYTSKMLAEAKVIPAVPAGQRAAEPIRRREIEELRDG